MSAATIPSHEDIMKAKLEATLQTERMQTLVDTCIRAIEAQHDGTDNPSIIVPLAAPLSLMERRALRSVTRGWEMDYYGPRFWRRDLYLKFSIYQYSGEDD